MNSDYTVGMKRSAGRVPDIPLGFDITDLLIYEEQKKEEQRKRDEAYRLPLHAPQPLPETNYRRPEPQKRDEERGVYIFPRS